MSTGVVVSTALPLHKFPLIFHAPDGADIRHCLNMEFRALAAHTPKKKKNHSKVSINLFQCSFLSKVFRFMSTCW